MPEHVAAARALRPIHERQVLGRSILLFDAVDRQKLATLGEVRTPSIADLFVAVMDDKARSGRMNIQSNDVPESSLERRKQHQRLCRPPNPCTGRCAANYGRTDPFISRHCLSLPSCCAASYHSLWSAGQLRQLAALDAAHQLAVPMTYGHAAMLIILTGFIVGVFYCLDALHGERRDRSILFWKSLPVSDVTTVLSKAAVPLVVLPLLVFAIVVAMQWIMLLLSAVVLMLTGVGTAKLWPQVPLLQMELSLLYGLTALALWHAPIYSWLLLVSGWARRAAFLWAFFPLLTVIIFEKIAFKTSHFASLLEYLLIGWFTQAFAATPTSGPVDPHYVPLSQLAPARFLSTPGLWIGLAAAALFLTVAVRIRRYRGPI